MNILIFSTNSHYFGTSVGGAETSLSLIAEKLAQIGENISYATIHLCRIPHQKMQEIKGVKVYSLSPLRWPYFKGKLLPMTRSKVISLQLEKFLANLLKRQRIDIVHTQNTFPNTYDILRIRVKYRLKFKVIQSIGGLYWSHQIEKNICASGKIEWVFNNVDAINFVSPGLKDLFYKTVEKHRLNVLPKKQSIMDIGVDLDDVRALWDPRKTKSFKIVCVARFAAIAKRQDLLIEAVSRLKNNNITVEFVGDGTMLNRNIERVKQLGLHKRITFHGMLPQKKITELLARANLFVLPTDYEGLGKAVLEGMAVGLPCLVSNVSALNSYIREGYNGFLCANSREEWAEKIEMIYKKKDVLSHVSTCAREFVLTNYDANKNILKYKEEFERLIACSG